MIALQGTLALPYMVVPASCCLHWEILVIFAPENDPAIRKCLTALIFVLYTLKFKKRRVPSTFRIFRYSRGKLIFQPKNSNLDKKLTNSF